MLALPLSVLLSPDLTAQALARLVSKLSSEQTKPDSSPKLQQQPTQQLHRKSKVQKTVILA